MTKAFCRIYQAIVKAALYFLPWKVPKVIEGPGSVKKLPHVVKEQGFSKVLVVTGSVLMSLGVPKPLFDSLTEEGIEYVVFSGVQPNPTDKNVYEGLKLYQENNCEALIAFGGGSPMDCCKIIGALAVKKGKRVEQLQGLCKIRKKTPAIFAVPTTAGTGSETTIAAVITNAETHHKAPISDTCLMPAFAVLDPELTKGLPPKVTAATGMDALCHAVESYTNNTYNTRLERDLAEKAVKLIYDNLYEAYCHGDNLKARQNMQKAAFYAGRAFTRGSVGYVHAIGHTLGGLYGTPHGLAMAILLPHVMRQFGPSVYKSLARLADICDIQGNDNETKAKAFIGWIEDINRKMSIPGNIDVIKDEDVPQIIEWALKEGNPLYPVPVVWEKRDFENIIRTVRQ